MCNCSLFPLLNSSQNARKSAQIKYNLLYNAVTAACITELSVSAASMSVSPRNARILSSPPSCVRNGTSTASPSGLRRSLRCFFRLLARSDALALVLPLCSCIRAAPCSANASWASCERPARPRHLDHQTAARSSWVAVRCLSRYCKKSEASLGESRPYQSPVEMKQVAAKRCPPILQARMCVPTSQHWMRRGQRYKRTHCVTRCIRMGPLPSLNAFAAWPSLRRLASCSRAS